MTASGAFSGLVVATAAVVSYFNGCAPAWVFDNLHIIVGFVIARALLTTGSAIFFGIMGIAMVVAAMFDRGGK